MKLQVIPISLREANEFVINFHRHSKKTRGHKYSDWGLQMEKI